MSRPFARAYAIGAFDDIGARGIRFLEEAARLGPLTVFLWPDEAVARLAGSPPKLGLEERRYYLEALRFVARVEVAPAGLDPDLPDLPRSCVLALGGPPGARLLGRLQALGVAHRVIGPDRAAGFPYAPPPVDAPRDRGQKRVVVTGCFDYLHTGHLRFFEEAAAYGELNVVLGSDANVRLLKGPGHPLFPEAERRYAVAASRHVARCLVSTGSGWLDAEPEILALGAERYVVNEDGDRPEKRGYCEATGLEYIVLKRTPKAGLPRRSSTDLRGF